MSRKTITRAALAHSRRTARADAHAQLMQAHAEHRAAMETYSAAFDAWVSDDCIGPRPIAPVS